MGNIRSVTLIRSSLPCKVSYVKSPPNLLQSLVLIMGVHLLFMDSYQIALLLRGCISRMNGDLSLVLMFCVMLCSKQTGTGT